MHMKLRQAGILILICVFFVSLPAGFTGCGKKPETEPEPRVKQLRAEPVITVYMQQTGKIKKMKMEDYLLGVVAAEMSPDWPIQALAAQAILARTFTMAEIAQGGIKNRGTDASTDVNEFQAWDGSKVNNRVRKAVRMTRGMVVTYHGQYINAWFHSYSGGKTATAKEGLNYRKAEPPYIKVVKDIDVRKFANPDVISWSVKIPVNEIAAYVSTATSRPVDRVHSIAIIEKGPSGRTVTLLVNGKSINGPNLRNAIGSERIRSTLLTEVRLRDGFVIFKGRGFGHGVGMSQWGAYGLAKKGKNFTQIIKYYFKDVQVQKIWK